MRDEKSHLRIASDPGVGSAGSLTTPAPSDSPAKLELRLLGGFSLRSLNDGKPISGWQRRTAKTLIKLLATHPGHGLHREQILELLWPEVDLDSGLNSFGKALHAARRALEPDLPPRRNSSYLRLTDSRLILETDLVEIDADRFEQLAQEALKSRDVDVFEAALGAYGGELLPEDLYEDWSEERRGCLAELHMRLLTDLSTLLARRGALAEAADRLREALNHDSTREDLHRRLMRLYTEMGTPDLAVRQFHACEDVLRRRLDLSPQDETVSIYRALLSARRGGSRPPEVAVEEVTPQPLRRSVVPAPGPPSLPLIGREPTMARLLKLLTPGSSPGPRTVIIAGEAGMGKTRLLHELAIRGRRARAAVLWGGGGGHAHSFAYGPFSIAIESYVASCTEAERRALARRYPELGRIVPSLMGETSQAAAQTDEHADVVPAILRLLTELGRSRPVLLILGDLNDADHPSIDLLHYLAHLAVDRPWLIAGAVREEEAQDPELRRLIAATLNEELCVRVELGCLSRDDCDAMVRTLLAPHGPSTRLLDNIYANSRGNPLFVEEVARSCVAQERDRAPRLVGGGSGGVPERVRALATMQLAMLPDTVRRVLELASLASTRRISLDELRRAVSALNPPIPESDLFDALDHALHTRVLEEEDEGYSFRYPLVRAALAHGLSRHRRAQLSSAVNGEVRLDQATDPAPRVITWSAGGLPP